MISLDDAAVRLRLAGLDHLTFVVGVVELEAVLGRHQEAKITSLRKRLNKVYVLCVNVKEMKMDLEGQDSVWSCSLQVSWARLPL